jgi:predicted O-methyltransferase YrrM
MSTQPSTVLSQGNQLDEVLPELATVLEVPVATVESYYADLRSSADFLGRLNAAVEPVPEFPGVHFDSVDDLRLYRCFLYVLTRALQPRLFVETGMMNGFSSAFILLALHHNGAGILHSVDIPPADARILAQGNSPLPAGASPGWVIPDYLRDKHVIHFGRAEELLPQLFQDVGPVDVFLHDSDHSYTHMMFELSLAWINVRAGGWVVCDNLEANQSFYNFARGAGVESTVLASFDSPERTWRHGLIRKPPQG